MTDAPLRIWATVNGVRRRDPSGAVSLIGGWESEDWGRGGHEYHLHTREALAQSPIVQAMIKEAVGDARKAGWKACIDNLMAGGVQVGADYHEDGQCIGRVNMFFPAGSTNDGRSHFFADFAKIEIALKDAKPMDFGDSRFKRAEPTNTGAANPCAEGHDCPSGPHGACCGCYDAAAIRRRG